MSTDRQLNIRVNLDTGQLEQQAGRATDTLASIGDKAQEQGSRVDNVLKGIGATMAAAFAIDRVKGFISQVISVRSEIQSLGVSFETLLGSKEKADQLFGQIRQYATSTPMQLNDLAAGAQTMLGFNIAAEKVMPMLRAIGDISMGDAQKFNSLTLAFSQMSAAGRLMGQDLLQMVNAGFNPLATISEKTGKSMATLKDEMSAGSISAEMVEQAFRDATAEGGKFHGMLEQQSKTLRGALSNLQGAYADFLNDLGASSEGILAGGVNMAYEALKNYKQVGEYLAVLIGVYGVYKASVMANTVADAAALDMLNAKIAAVGQVAAAEATGIELKVQQAIASNAMTKAQGEEVLAAYALAKARVADLQTLKTQTAAELEAAVAAEAAAAQRVAAAKARLAAAELEADAALESTSATAMDTAATEINSAQTELNAAIKEEQAAANGVATASKKADAAATAADTAAQELDTVATTTSSKATSFLVGVKGALQKATAKLYATMKAHPYALAAAAVAALAYGIYKLCTYQTTAEKNQEDLNKAHADAQGKIATEKVEIDRLFKALRAAKKGTEEWKKARDDIWSKYGGWLKTLGDENTALNDQAKAYALVAENARDAANAKALEAFIADKGKEQAEKMGEIYKKAKDLVVEKYGQAYADKHVDEIRRVVDGTGNARQGFIDAFGKRTTRTSYNARTGTYNTYSRTSNPMLDLINKGKKQSKEYKKVTDEAVIRFGSPKDPGSPTIPDTPQTKTGTGKTGTGKTGTGKTPEEIAAEKAEAQQKETDLIIQQLNERRAAMLAYDNELEQARIDILREGAGKRRRQRELDIRKEAEELHAKMLSDIEAEVNRQKALFDAREDANAAGKEHYAKKTFNAGQALALDYTPGTPITAGTDTGDVDQAAINAILERYGLLRGLMVTRHAQAIQKQTDEERQAINDYLREYGTFAEKRIAIEQQTRARMETATNDAERLSAQREGQQALSALGMDEITTRLSSAFGEVGKLSRSTIDRLIGQMESLRGHVMEAFDPASIQKFSAALSNLYRARETASAGGGLFSGFGDKFLKPDYFKQRAKAQAAAQAEVNEAERLSLDLHRQRAKAEDEVLSKTKAIQALVKSKAGIGLSADQLSDGTTLSGIIGQLEAKGDTDTAQALRGLSDGLGTSRRRLAETTGAAEKATESFRSLKDSWKEAFSGDKGTLEAANAVVDKVSKEVQAANALMQDLASTAEALGADVSEGSGWDTALKVFDAFTQSTEGLKQAISSAMSGNIMGTVGGVTKVFSSWITGFAAIHDASHERTIKRLQKEIEELDRVNKRLQRQVDKQYSRQASGTYEEQVRQLEKQAELIRQQIDAENSKKKKDKDRIREWQDKLEEIQWQIEDTKEKALDAIIGEDVGSSIDSFADALVGAWGRAGDTARATKDYVKTMLRQMVIEAMKTDLSTPITRLREMMAAALGDDVVTEAERRELEAFARQLADETEKKYRWADGILTDVRDSGSATSGSFATASQDSINELSGRAAAIHTSGELRRQLLTGISLDTAAMRQQLAAAQESAEEMRSLQLLSVGHLETIARNTGQLYEMNDRLDRIERNTRAL